MKPQDLMVGDFIFCKSISKPARVEGISMRESSGSDGYTFILRDESNTALHVRAASVSPIPLTPEILEKNGFKKKEKDEYIPADRYTWGREGKRDGYLIEITPYSPPINGVKVLTRLNCESSKDGGVNNFHSCDIESVHELQHALKLCGIDKTIEL